MTQRIHPVLKWGCLAPIVVILAVTLGLVALDYVMPSAPRKALPASATDVKEYYSGDWNGDYERLLRANIPEADYPLFAKSLGLKERFDPIAHADIASWINVGFSDQPPWWNPPTAGQTTYFEYDPKHYSLRVLKYSSGYAYFVSASW